MAFTQNTLATRVKQPRSWLASIGNGDASAWKLLLRGDGTGAGGGGSKLCGIQVASTDTSSRIVQLARVRTFSGVTMTIASPGVVSWSAANGNNVAVGDQVMFLNDGDTLPTGLAFNTTYFVIAGGFSFGASFELAASAGGTAINTSGSQSGTHVIGVVRPMASQTVAITAGTDGATSTGDLHGLNTALSFDNDSQKYLILESSDYLAVSATTTVTANKMISVSADGGDF